MRRFGKTLIAGVLAASMVVTPVLADDLQAMQEHIDELQQDADNIQAALDQAESERAELQSELTELLGNLDKLENDLIAKGEEIMQKEEELKAEEKKEKIQYAAMKLRIRYMYESGNGRLIMAVLSAEDMTDALNKAEYANEISNYDRNMIDAYIETERQISDMKAVLEEEQDEMLALQAEYLAQQEQLDELIAQKSAEVDNFDAQLASALSAVAAAEAEKQKAEEEERARREALAAAQQAALSGGESNNGGGSGGGGQTYGDPNASSSIPYDGSAGSIIVAAAYTQIGVPYVWGGTTPYKALDCSGLVQYCYRQAGIYIPRTSSAMAASGTTVYDPQPGDICWTPGHVAIYIGNGQMIEAQQSGVPVKVSRVRVSRYLRFR